MVVEDTPESHSSENEQPDELLTAVKVESKPFDFFFEQEVKSADKPASPKA